jgi:hypothetical protein
MDNITQVCFGPMIGELGWALSRWYGYCRFRRFTEFRNLRSLAIDYDWRYPLYSDFIDEFIPLPSWVSELGWEQDCYELVPPDAHPGAVTPPSAYANILADCANLYDRKVTWTVRPPRGCNFFIQFKCRQMWKPLEPSEKAQTYVDSLLYNSNKDVVVVSARGRERSADRNVPEFVWGELINAMVSYGFTVVITGTPHGSFLTKKIGRNIINVISTVGVDGLDILIAFMKRAKFSVTSQSGPTHISLHCETPSYIVGHEATRHSMDENYLKTPVMFRTVPNNIYTSITAKPMFEDIVAFNQQMSATRQRIETVYNDCFSGSMKVMHDLIYSPPIDFYDVNVQSMQQEIINAVQR